MPKEKLCDCGKPISQCQCKGHNHSKNAYTSKFEKKSNKPRKKTDEEPPPDPIDNVKDWVSALLGGANAAANAVIRDAQGKQLYDDKYKENPTGNIITDTVLNLVNSVANASDHATRAAKDSINARGHSIAGRRNGRSADEVRVYPSGGNWHNPKAEAGLEGMLNDIGRRINAGRNAIDEAIVRPIKRYNERAKQDDENRKKEKADFNIRWHKDGPQRQRLSQVGINGDWYYLQAYEPRATPAYPSGGNWYDPESESGISGIVTNATRAMNRMRGKPEKQTREGTSNRRSSYEENERNKHKKNESGGSRMAKRKVQMCEDCGKPEFACKCKGHQGGRSMSKAMCKCGSGMSKAMCKCGGMGKSMHKAYNPPIPLPPLPGRLGSKMRDAAGDVYGTVMSFAGKMPRNMKDMFGFGNMHDIFKDSPMKLFGRMGKRGNINKNKPLPPPPDFDDLVDKLVDMLPGEGARQLMNSYQTGNLFADTPDYIDYLSPQKRLQQPMKNKRSVAPIDLFRDSPMKLSRRMNKRGNKVSKVWPLPDSDFERNGGQVGPQRRRGFLTVPEFGYESMEGYNPAENAVRQMMPTPSDVAAYNRNTKEKALANAFSDLMGAYGNELGASVGNWDWWNRTANRADRAANNTANAIASMFPEPKLGAPRGMLKRLSKSMKMDADMAKQPQKITPKRTIRHTDKYFK